MTDDDLKAIRARDAGKWVTDAVADRRALLAEVDRLRAEHDPATCELATLAGQAQIGAARKENDLLRALFEELRGILRAFAIVEEVELEQECRRLVAAALGEER